MYHSALIISQAFPEIVQIPKTEVPPWYITSILIPIFISIFGSILTLISGYFLGKRLGLFNANLTKTNQKEISKDDRVVKLEEKVSTLEILKAVNEARTDLKAEIQSVNDRVTKVHSDLKAEIQSVNDRVTKVHSDLKAEIQSVRTDLTIEIKNSEQRSTEKMEALVTGSTNSVRAVLASHEVRISKLEATNKS
jgi:hypothetical protein